VLGYRLVLDHSARLDSRFLGPLHVAAAITLVPSVYRRLGGAQWSPVLRRRVAAVGVAVVALHGIQGVVWLGRGLVDESVGRRGLTGRQWRESPVLAMVEQLAPGVPVYTNATDAVHLLTGRAAKAVPAKRDQFSGRDVAGYGEDLVAMRIALERTGGLVVYFLPFEDRGAFLPSVEELRRVLDLSVVTGDEVATAYRVRGA
jgi:hypothetical protein